MWPVRWLHVASTTIAIGGAALVWASLRLDSRGSFGVAIAYEWLFWGAIGVVAMTGVGNLGDLAPAVPPVDTRWGTILALKLVAVLMLLVGSAIRAAFLLQIAGSADRIPDADRGRLTTIYAATAGWLFGLLALAEVLAHGG